MLHHLGRVTLYVGVWRSDNARREKSKWFLPWGWHSRTVLCDHLAWLICCVRWMQRFASLCTYMSWKCDLEVNIPARLWVPIHRTIRCKTHQANSSESNETHDPKNQGFLRVSDIRIKWLEILWAVSLQRRDKQGLVWRVLAYHVISITYFLYFKKSRIYLTSAYHNRSSQQVNSTILDLTLPSYTSLHIIHNVYSINTIQTGTSSQLCSPQAHHPPRVMSYS